MQKCSLGAVKGRAAPSMSATRRTSSSRSGSLVTLPSALLRFDDVVADRAAAWAQPALTRDDAFCVTVGGNRVREHTRAIEARLASPLDANGHVQPHVYYTCATTGSAGGSCDADAVYLEVIDPLDDARVHVSLVRHHLRAGLLHVTLYKARSTPTSQTSSSCRIAKKARPHLDSACVIYFNVRDGAVRFAPRTPQAFAMTANPPCFRSLDQVSDDELTFVLFALDALVARLTALQALRQAWEASRSPTSFAEHLAAWYAGRAAASQARATTGSRLTTALADAWSSRRASTRRSAVASMRHSAVRPSASRRVSVAAAALASVRDSWDDDAPASAATSATAASAAKRSSHRQM